MGVTPAAFSLRRTLAVRFSLTMFVALLVLALCAYLGVRHTLMQELDRSLRGSAQLQANKMAVMRRDSLHQELPTDSFVRDINRFVSVRDSNGRILGSNSLRARDLVFNAAAFQRARSTGPYLTTEEWRGTRLRSIYVAMPSSGAGSAALIQVAASLGPLDASLRTILRQMLATVLLGSLATAVGAGWLAGSAVAPVQAIAEEAGNITGEVSGRRIRAHADVLEFQGLIQVLNAMLARLEQASGWHRRIIRDLGHDLRTPVTAMRAGVEVALWGERTPEDYRRILTGTLEEIDRLGLICDALVLLGRLQAGEVSLNMSVLDARMLAREAIAGVQDSLGQHSIELVEDSQPVRIPADPRLIRMVLDQLLDNARRYTPAGSHIEVKVGAEAERAQITVEDNGSGLADEVLPHLFEPFYRSDTARGRDGGPGLGLTATLAVVTLHRGTISAERGPKGGLRVTVTLPRTDAPVTSGSLGRTALPASARTAVVKSA